VWEREGLSVEKERGIECGERERDVRVWRKREMCVEKERWECERRGIDCGERERCVWRKRGILV
jgi:hypothetical protein